MAVARSQFDRVALLERTVQLTEAGRGLFWAGYFRSFEKPRLGSLLMCRVHSEDGDPYVVYGLLRFLEGGEDGFLELEVGPEKLHTVSFTHLVELDGDLSRIVAAANRAVRMPLRSRARRRETILEL